MSSAVIVVVVLVGVVVSLFSCSCRCFFACLVCWRCFRFCVTLCSVFSCCLSQLLLLLLCLLLLLLLSELLLLCVGKFQHTPLHYILACTSTGKRKYANLRIRCDFLFICVLSPTATALLCLSPTSSHSLSVLLSLVSPFSCSFSCSVSLYFYHVQSARLAYC